MNKGIVVKSVVILVILASAHSIFWFFKAGQVEKQIQNFVGENGAYISVGEVAVSGFPLSQKISVHDLKFVIPNAALSKYQTTVKTIEASASIFSKDFVVSMVDQVTVQDLEGNSINNVEFVQSPEVKLTFSGDTIAKFVYKDSGYRVLDSDKVVTYVAGSSSVSFESIKEEDKFKNKLKVSITDIEGFDVVSVYKNAVEGKIMDGIKTGEITVGSSASGLVSTNASQTTSVQDAAATGDVTGSTAVITNVSSNDVAVTQNNVVTTTQQNNVVKSDTVDVKTVTNSVADIATQNPVADPVQTDSTTKVVSDGSGIPASTENIVSKDQPIKSNLVLDVEYELVPSSPDQQSQAAMDPTQVQEISGHYNKVMKLNNFEFSNSLYKVTVSGQLNILQDDNMPSGAVTVKIEKLDSLVSKFIEGLSKSDSQAKMISSSQDSVAVPVDNAAAVDIAPVPASDMTVDSSAVSAAPVVDPYQDFINRLSTKMSALSKEVAQKSPLTTEDSATFDVRREKNLEILVNETSVREILGKL